MSYRKPSLPFVSVTLDAYDPALPGQRNLVFVNSPLGSSGIQKISTPVIAQVPTDAEWIAAMPRLISVPTKRRYLEDGLALEQAAVELNNEDGALDDLYKYVFAGRLCSFNARLDHRRDGLNDSMSQAPNFVWQMVMEQPEFGPKSVTIKLRGMTYGVDTPLHLNTYGGTGGLDGDADLTGRVKPLVFGFCRHFQPVLVDKVKLIYQLSDVWRSQGAGNGVDSIGTGGGVMKVYDSGVELTRGADYTSVADMNATAPAAGTFRALSVQVATTGSYVRLGTTPTGAVHADYEYMRYLGSIGTGLKVTSLCQAFLAHANNYAPAFTYLPSAAQDLNASFYSKEQIFLKDAFQAVLKNHRLSLTLRPTGLSGNSILALRDPTSGTVVLTIDGTDKGAILQFDRTTAVPRDLPSLPIFRVRGGYQKNWDVLSSGFAAAATLAYREFALREHRLVSSTDASIQTTWPLADEYDVLTDEPDATDIAVRAAELLAALKVRRDFFVIRAKIPANVVTDLFTGSLDTSLNMLSRVQVTNYPRFGCTVSRDFLVLEQTIHYETSVVDLLVWG